MPGKFNVMNSMGAAAACIAAGLPAEQAVSALNTVKGVCGRAEVLHDGDYTVICDYAHTEDALQKTLSAIKPFVKGRLIVVFGAAGEAALAAAARLRPDAVVCVGQAGGRAGVTPELVAVNLRSARIPDNAGNAPMDEPVVPGGPDGLFSTLPVEEMAARVRALGLPASVSYSAGTYVCNDLMYTVLHHFAGTGVRAGFIHVPFLPEQAEESVPSLPLSDMVRALTAAIGALDGAE